MGLSTKIMKGSFRRGLNLEEVTFSTKLAVQPTPQYKSHKEKQDGSLHNLFRDGSMGLPVALEPKDI